MCYDNYAFIVITKNGSNEFLQSLLQLFIHDSFPFAGMK